MSPVSNLGSASSFMNASGANVAFTPVPIPHLSPMPGGGIGDVIQHLPPMSDGNLGDVIQHLPPMPGGSLGDLVGGLLNGSGPGLHPSVPQGRQTVG
jgi:hypothetical protein